MILHKTLIDFFLCTDGTNSDNGPKPNSIALLSVFRQRVMSTKKAECNNHGMMSAFDSMTRITKVRWRPETLANPCYNEVMFPARSMVWHVLTILAMKKWGLSHQELLYIGEGRGTKDTMQFISYSPIAMHHDGQVFLLVFCCVFSISNKWYKVYRNIYRG